ncbi:ethylene receptor [Genlisea aurea]|uniref:Ethylene receptor n=1 Tax=Genlisea aurea TaxID=192259 RepID=S8CX00_9LAMI|nr:ethylene receptor [Genlisea aurea]
MVKAFASFVLLLSLCVSISASDNGIRCNCDDEGFWSIETIMECQKVSDFFIAVAYFSIPVELLCFVSCSNIPFKWVLVQFIAFIVLCGMTHLLSFWTYGPHSFQLMLALTIFKFLTALVSFATAITLITLIPLLLKVKVREFMLWKKTWDLDQEVGMIKKKKEAALHVRMLTREIRKSLDRHTILYTTLVELSKTLDLKNCAVWMPNPARTEVHLTHELNERNLSSLQYSAVSVDDPDVRDIKTSNGVKILDPESALAAASGGGVESGSVAAIRMPMLKVSNFKGGTPEFRGPACYALLVLVLPDEQNRSWSDHELEIIEVVADQVAVALSHASVLEESQLMREKLEVQNRALQQAKQDALMASRARDSFQKGISNGLRRPMHSVVGLLSLLQDEKLSDNQRLPIDAMVKASNVLSTLTTDVMDTSVKDSGRFFPLEMRPFELHSTVKQAACLFKCHCAYRGCSFEVEIDKTLQNHVIGDERRVFQVILHMVGSLLDGIKQKGGSLMLLRVYKAHGIPRRTHQKWGIIGQPDDFAFIGFDVCMKHIDSQMENLSIDQQKYLAGVEESLSFNACKKLVQLMQGDIWVSSSREGFDEGMSLVLRFRTQVPAISEHNEAPDSNSHLQGLRVLLADADDLNRAITTKLLERLGLSVVASVSSGYECINVVGTPPVSSCQLLLLDLHLPDIDGCEVARRIRKFRTRNMPLIIGLNAGGGDDVETRDKWSQAGINGIIQKPVSFKEIGLELKRFLMQAANNSRLLSSQRM